MWTTITPTKQVATASDFNGNQFITLPNGDKVSKVLLEIEDEKNGEILAWKIIRDGVTYVLFND